MRPSLIRTRWILDCVRHQVGATAQGVLFRSRLGGGAASGGDGDVVAESLASPSLPERALVTMAREQALSLPVHTVAQQHGSAFARNLRVRAQSFDAEA